MFVCSNLFYYGNWSALFYHWVIEEVRDISRHDFRKFKVALNRVYRIFLNFAKSCILSCLSKFYNRKKRFEIWALKAKLRVFLAGHSVAMVTYCVTKLIPTCSPVIGHDTMIVASIDKERLIMTHQNLPLEKSWKLFWATLNSSRDAVVFIRGETLSVPIRGK